MQITCPVFILCGEHDIFANAAGCASGGSYYPNSASVTSFVQPDMGHVYNLHMNAVPGWEKVLEFVRRVAGSDVCGDDVMANRNICPSNLTQSSVNM